MRPRWLLSVSGGVFLRHEGHGEHITDISLNIEGRKDSLAVLSSKVWMFGYDGSARIMAGSFPPFRLMPRIKWIIPISRAI